MRLQKKSLVRIYLIVFLSLPSLNKNHCIAQENTTFFSNLTTKEGLPSNITTSVIQDKYDFIWIGTGSGLARYDGHHFKVFKRDQSEISLSSNEISTILADGDILWVGTWSGLCTINVRTFDITRIDLGAALAIRALYKDSEGVLWIGTGNGLFQYNTGTNTFDTYRTQNSQLSHNTIRSIYEDQAKNLWIGTYDGLNKLDRTRKTLETLDLRTSGKIAPKNHLILDIKPNDRSDSLLWVGTETGLYSVNRFTKEAWKCEKTFLSNDVIKSIYTDPSGRLWLGTDFGLNVYDPLYQTHKVYFNNPRQSYSLANNVVWQIFEDRSGILWLTTSNGLSLINPQGHFYQYQEIAHEYHGQQVGNQVKSMLIDSKGVRWLGTQDGVIKIDSSGNQTLFNTQTATPLLSDNIYALEEDIWGRIWIGSAGGINVWDDFAKKMHNITASATNSLRSNYIGKFTKTGKDIWVSVWEGGLYRISNGLEKLDSISFEAIPGFESGSEKTVAGDSSLWIIDVDELYQLDTETLQKKKIEAFTKVSKRQTIYSLYFSLAGDLWAGTQNGLIQYSPKHNTCCFHRVLINSDVMINSITEDMEGNIWSCTNSSVQKISADGHLEIYPLDDGLPIRSFYYGCTAKTKEGQIIFGGDNGYISFSPGQAKPNTFDPKVYISSIEINNQKISVGDQQAGTSILSKDVSFTEYIELKYAQRSITFEFASLHYWQPGTNTFVYMLEGLDEEWSRVSGVKNFAVFSSLPPGDYTLRVRGINNYGIQSESEASISFTIKPPILLSTGFIVVYGIILGAVIFYGLHFYSARVHLKNELRIIRLEKQHAEEIDRTKEEFFINISHELRTPISLILPPIHELLKKNNLDPQSRTLATLAEKNSVRLLKLVNQILDFNKLADETLQIRVSRIDMVQFCREVFDLFGDQAKRQLIDFSFASSAEGSLVCVDPEKIETVLFNLLSNAFKFTPKNGRISLEIKTYPNDYFKEGAFEFSIHDSGVGISSEEKEKIFDRFYQTEHGRKMRASSGIGLTLAAEYVRLHHGTITVESELREGTTFIVRLPLGSGHLPVDAIGDAEVSLKATRSMYSASEGSKAYHLNLVSELPTILLIEDNPDVTQFIRSSLENKYHFVVAENGEEGLEKANNFMPELIISDIMMPVMDGMQVCHQIKTNPRTSHIMMIMLTAKSVGTSRLEGIRQGADVYLTKPFEIDLLEAHLHNLLHRKQELTNYFRKELVNQPNAPQTKDNQDTRFVKKVMDIVEANISDPDFSVEIISNEIGMSSTHLYRRLKAITDHSAQDIIKKYRIKKASLLLANNEGNISEIMFKVGFSSPSYFSKCFKAEFGMTPKEYQQKMVGSQDNRSI